MKRALLFRYLFLFVLIVAGNFPCGELNAAPASKTNNNSFLFTPGTERFTNYNSSGFSGKLFKISSPAGDPIYSFGNSAVRINITGFEIIYPEAVSKFSGELIFFNTNQIAELDDIRFNPDGEIAGTLASTIQKDILVGQNGVGNYKLRINGYQGTFSFDPSTQQSSINITLTNPQFTSDINGVFSKQTKFITGFTGSLKHKSDSPETGGFEVSNISPVLISGVQLSDNPVKFDQNVLLFVNSPALSSLSYREDQFIFKYQLNSRFSFPGLQLKTTDVTETELTLNGLSFPGNGGLALVSESGSTTARSIAGYTTVFLTAKVNSFELNRAPVTNPTSLTALIKYSGFPVGSSENLRNAQQGVNVTFNSSGLTITHPVKLYTNTFISLPGDLKFYLSELRGTITGTLVNGAYLYNSGLSVNGKIRFAAGVMGFPDAVEHFYSGQDLFLNGNGQLIGRITRATTTTPGRNGLFVLTLPEYEIKFATVNGIQTVETAGNGSINLSPLTGVSQNAGVAYRYDVASKIWSEFNGNLNTLTEIPLPKGSSQFRLQMDRVAITKDGIKINGRSTVLFGANGSTGATINNVLFAYASSEIASGAILFDKGFSFNVKPMNNAAPIITIDKITTAFPPQDGAAINAPGSLVYNASGLVIASAVDTAYLVHKGRTYKVSAVYQSFIAGKSPFSVVSGSISFMSGNKSVATLSSSGYIVDENSLPSLPEKIALLNSGIGYLIVKEGNNALVDWNTEGNLLRIRTRPDRVVNAVFPSLKLNAAITPSVPVTFDILVDKTNYDIVDGTISASMGSAAQSGNFDLTLSGIPAKLTKVRFAKNTTGIYELTFDALINLFKTDLNSTPVVLKLNAQGLLNGEFSINANKNISLRTGVDSDKLILQANSLTGSIETEVINFVKPEYSIDITGGLKLKMHNGSYAGANAIFRVTANGIEKLNYVEDAFYGASRLNLGSLRLRIDAFRLPELSFSNTTGWKYQIILDAALNFVISGADFTTHSVKDIVLSETGITIPVIQKNDISTPPFIVEGFNVSLRNFRSEAFAIKSLDTTAFNINTAPVKFDFTVWSSGYPAHFPSKLKTSKIYVQNAGFVRGFLSGEADSIQLYSQKIDLGRGSSINVTEIDGGFTVVNGRQSFKSEVEASFIIPSDIAVTGQSKEIKPSANSRLAISHTGLITGSNTVINTVMVQAGKTGYYCVPGCKVEFTANSGNQGVAIKSTSMDITVKFSDEQKASGTGNATFDFMQSKITSGSVTLGNEFTATLPSGGGIFNFKVAGATIDSKGLTINGNHSLVSGNELIPVSFSSFVLEPGTLAYTGGSFSIQQPFAFNVFSASGNTQWSAVTTGFTPSVAPSLLFNLSGFTFSGGTNKFTGDGIGKANNNGEVITGLKVVYEGSPEVDFINGRVKKGSITFYNGSVKAAFIDTTGINIVNLSSAGLRETLVLGDIKNAYIILRKGETKYVKTENVATGLRITSLPGKTVELVVPGLKYSSANAPVFNITLDVVVNPTTYAFVSEAVTYQVSANQPALDLSPFGIPFKVTQLKYAKGSLGYTLTASGKVTLPQVLNGLEAELTEIGFAGGRLNGFVSKGAFTEQYNPTGTYQKMAKIGAMAEFKLQGVEYTFGQNPEFKLSGDIKSKLFKYGTNDTSNIHFTATYKKNAFQFVLSSGSTEGMKINKLSLMPTAINDTTFALGFTSENFNLIVNGVLQAKEIAPGFELSVNNLRINKDAVSINPVNITTASQEQSFTMFATEFTLKNIENKPAVTYTYSSDQFSVKMSGVMQPFGKMVIFNDLTLSGNGSISMAPLKKISTAAPLTVIGDRLWITGIAIVSANNKDSLEIKGDILLPRPATQTKMAYAVRIAPGQRADERVEYTLLKEAPGIGSDPTEQKFWAGIFDLQYVSLEINYGDYPTSQIKTVSAFYVDGADARKYIKFGSVSGNSVEPGMTINFEGKYEWAEELDFAEEANFTYNNLKYDLDPEDIEFEPDSTNGYFVMKVGGAVGLNTTGFTGALNFSGLEVTSTDSVKKFKECITGGNISIAPLITAEITRLAFSSTPTSIYIPDPNGEKIKEGPEKGQVKTIKVPVTFYLVFGGSLEIGKFADGGIDSLLVYKKTDGSVNFVIQNFNFRKKDKIEFRLSIAMLSGSGTDFSLSMAGFCDFNGKVLAAFGKVQKWQGKFSAGLFVAALEGVEISFFGIADLSGIGGGFFFNPTENDITTVRDLCGFTDEYTSSIKEKIKTTPVTGTPLFTIFLYARLELGQPVPPANEAPLAGTALLTIANDRLMIDAKVEALGRKEELYGLLNIEVSFTQKYIEGYLNATLDLRFVITANATMKFFYYSQKNWGVVGTAMYKIIGGVLSGNGEFYAGSKGFYAAVDFKQKFDVWVVSIEGGMGLKVWYKPNVSWGAYCRLEVKAAVLGGIVSARGVIKGVLIGSPEFALVGGATLQIRALFVKWSGDVWIKIVKKGISAGFGKDETVQRVIAIAEGMSNDFLKEVQSAKADMESNKPIPSLNITKEVIDAASAELVKKIIKARTLTAENNLTQSEKDSLAQYLTSELVNGENASVRNYLTALNNNLTAAGTEIAKTEIKALLNEVNNAINEYKTSISRITQEMSTLAMNTEEPENASPEGVTDPVEGASFSYPSGPPSEEPRATDPYFLINEITVANNKSVVTGYMAQAEAYHNMLKRNIEIIENSIAKFDAIFTNPQNNFLQITDKYTSLVEKVQNYMKKLSQYHYNDLNASLAFRNKMITDTSDFFSNLFKRSFANEGQMKLIAYRRWARIRGLSGLNKTPWDAAEFDNVWTRYNAAQKDADARSMAKNLYFVIPDQAFYSYIGNKKSAFLTLDSEFREKMENIEEFSGEYTQMLDELFVKRRKMSEALFELVEGFIYWKDRPVTNSADKSGDYLKLSPTLAELQAKATKLIADNTSPKISVNATVQTNSKSYSELLLSWSGTHSTGIVEYSIASSYLPGGFKSLGKRTSWNPHLFLEKYGEYTRTVSFRIRARSGSGFTTSDNLFAGSVSMGFTEANITGPARSVTATPPVDNTTPLWKNIPDLVNVYPNSIIGIGTFKLKPENDFPVSSSSKKYRVSETNSLRVKFKAEDPETDIASYRYKIYFRDKSDNWSIVRDWQNIGAVEEYLIQGLDLKDCIGNNSSANSTTTSFGNETPRYVIAFEPTNGAGKAGPLSFLTVVVDTTKPYPMQEKDIAVPKVVYGLTKYYQSPGTIIRNGATTAVTQAPVREGRKIVFAVDKAKNRFGYVSGADYYYNVYAMPDNIKLNSDWIITNQLYLGSYGIVATIPPAYAAYKDFKIEVMCRLKNGAFSPVFSTTKWANPVSYTMPVKNVSVSTGPYSPSRTTTEEAYPTPPQVFWFKDKNSGPENVPLKLYFKTLGESQDSTGIYGYQYSIRQQDNGVTTKVLDALKWYNLPAVPESGVVPMDAAFFAPFSDSSWFVPGREIYIYIRSVSNSYWASKGVTVVGPVAIAPPSVGNLSVDIVKRTEGLPNKYTAQLTIMGEKYGTNKKYYVRTQMMLNNMWVSPELPLKYEWTEVYSVNGMFTQTIVDLYSMKLMPLRDGSVSGTGFINKSQRWRIEIKTVDTSGNESDIVTKEVIW